MTLKERLNEDLKTAMLAHEALRVSTIRLVKAAIQNSETRTEKRELNDDEVLDVIVHEAKQRRDAIDEFKKAARNDLVEKAEAEIEILKGYLPAEMSETDLRGLIIQAIEKTGAAGPRDMGKVMGILMPQVKGRADGKLVNRLVNEVLNK